MCVIVHVPPAMKVDPDNIKKCWKANNNGGGMMWVSRQEKKFVIEKGFKSLELFLTRMKFALEDRLSDLVMHFRIATHGGIKPELTHPFWVDEDRLAFAHNGILDIKVEDKDQSDTSTFVDLVLKKLPKGWEEDGAIMYLLEVAIGTDKIIIMRCDGQIVKLGNWTEVDGVDYSNVHWKYRSADTSKVFISPQLNQYYGELWADSQYIKDKSQTSQSDGQAIIDAICNKGPLIGKHTQWKSANKEMKRYEAWQRTHSMLNHNPMPLPFEGYDPDTCDVQCAFCGEKLKKESESISQDEHGLCAQCAEEFPACIVCYGFLVNQCQDCTKRDMMEVLELAGECHQKDDEPKRLTSPHCYVCNVQLQGLIDTVCAPCWAKELKRLKALGLFTIEDEEKNMENSALDAYIVRSRKAYFEKERMAV